MREKLGIAAFVIVLAAVWAAGFLWVRGDFSSPDKTANAKSSASPDASPDASPSATESSPGTAASSPSSVFTGKVEPLDEGKPVDVNPSLPRPKPQLLPPVAEFTVASFNILGSNHTAAGGHSPGLASGVQRMGGVLAILAAHDISVVGMQEMRPDQRTAFNNRAGGWSLYPGLQMGRQAGENSVAWRDDTWELVDPSLISIPYFNGRQRPMPYVLLRHKATGIQAYFSTFHNPADVYGPSQRYRTAATNREIGLFNQLERTGIPQFVTGDMNEYQEYFCRVTSATPLIAAAGGSNGGGCRPPGPRVIDWIFGSPGVQFSDYTIDRSPLVRRTTDHPVIVTDVKLDALKYAKAYQPAE